MKRTTIYCDVCKREMAVSTDPLSLHQAIKMDLVTLSAQNGKPVRADICSPECAAKYFGLYQRKMREAEAARR